jgi:hypothetical protein
MRSNRTLSAESSTGFYASLGTILASAVAMRTSTSTCIRSKAIHPRTIIDIHVSRSPKGTEGDQTTTGFRRTINLPGRQPPYRGCGKLKRWFVSITISALHLLGSRHPQQSATERSPISVQEQQCQPCGRAYQRRREPKGGVIAARPRLLSPCGSAAFLRIARTRPCYCVILLEGCMRRGCCLCTRFIALCCG